MIDIRELLSPDAEKLLGKNYERLGISIPNLPPSLWPITRLQKLPATDVLQAQLADFEQALATMQPIGSMPRDPVLLRARLQGEVRRIKLALYHAEIRDTLRALRPETCAPWCLGLGYRWRKIDPPPLDPHWGTIDDWAEFCRCDVGQQAKATMIEKRARSVAEQRQETMTRAWATANVPAGYDQVEFTKLKPGQNVDAYNQVMNWFNQPEQARDWLWITGPPGTGKTTLAVAIAKECLRFGQAALFVTTRQLFDAIKATWRADDDETPLSFDLVGRLATKDVLVIDDFGQTDLPTLWVGLQVTELIDTRIKDGRTVVLTTNMSIPALQKLYGNRLVDRILERSIPIKMEGQNYRLDFARQRGFDL